MRWSPASSGRGQAGKEDSEQHLCIKWCAQLAGRHRTATRSIGSGRGCSRHQLSCSLPCPPWRAGPSTSHLTSLWPAQGPPRAEPVLKRARARRNLRPLQHSLATPPPLLVTGPTPPSTHTAPCPAARGWPRLCYRCPQRRWWRGRQRRPGRPQRLVQQLPWLPR